MKVNSIKSGALWSLFGQAIEITLRTILFIIIARILGPESYGLLQSILAIIILSTLVSDFGLSVSVSRFLAENISDEKTKNNVIVVGLIIKGVFLGIAIGLVYIAVPYMEILFNIELESYKYLVILLIGIRSLREFVLRVLQGLRRLDLRVKINSVYFFVSTILTVILLLLGYGIQAVLVSEIVTTISILSFITTNLLYRRFTQSNLEGQSVFQKSICDADSRIILKKILKYSVPMLFISLSFYIYTKSDVLLIQYFLNSDAVGLYALATMVISKVHVPLVAIGQSAAPAFASMSNVSIGNTYLNVFRITLALSLPISTGIYLVSEFMVLAIFGDSYLESVPILKVMSLYLFFYCMNSVTSPILDYMGYAKYRARIVGVSACINIIFNIFFIPKYGPIGAGYSTIITYTLYSIYINFLLARLCFNPFGKYLRRYSSVFFKLLLNVVMMAVLVKLFLMVTPFNSSLVKLIFAIIIGLVTYVTALFLSRMFSIKEFRSLFSKSS